jgi:hypothetical protein
MAGKTDRLRGAGAIIPVRNQAVASHRTAKQFDSGKLLCEGKSRDPGCLRDLCDDTTMEAVRRLSYPPAECQSSVLDKVEQLRDGIGTVVRVQQSISKCRLISQLRGLAQQDFQRVSGRQRTEGTDEIPNLAISSVDTDSSAELLQHIDAGPPVWRVHHEMHRPVRFERSAQSAEARIRVGKVMEDPCARYLIEAHPQLIYALDRKLVYLKILQIVLFLELLSVAHTRRTAIDGGDLSVRPAQRMFGCLRCPTSGDKDSLVFPIDMTRPKQMKISSPLGILPTLLIFV